MMLLRTPRAHTRLLRAPRGSYGAVKNPRGSYQIPVHTESYNSKLWQKPVPGSLISTSSSCRSTFSHRNKTTCYHRYSEVLMQCYRSYSPHWKPQQASYLLQSASIQQSEIALCELTIGKADFGSQNQNLRLREVPTVEYFNTLQMCYGDLREGVAHSQTPAHGSRP